MIHLEKRFEDIFARRLEDVLKMSSKLLEDVLNMSWRRFSRCLEDVLKTSWRHLQNILKKFLQDVLKTSWKCLEDVLKTSWRGMAKTNILVLTKTSWRCLEDVFWRNEAKANIFVLMKMFWRKTFSRRLLKTKTKDAFRRLHQDECLLYWIQHKNSLTTKLAASDVFHMFTQSIKFIEFYYLTNVWKTWFIK